MDGKEYLEMWQKIMDEDKQRRQERREKQKQDAIKRAQEGKSLPGDYIYFQEKPKDKIAHQDDKIAHPDTMRKEPATILLIAGLVGSLIFKQWYLIWIMLLWWYFGKDRV